MERFNVKERFPSRSVISERVPTPSDETRLRLSIYSRLGAAILILVLGVTLFLSGLVLIPMMAVSYNVLAVVGAALMVSIGMVLAGGSYIWLTGPA